MNDSMVQKGGDFAKINLIFLLGCNLIKVVFIVRMSITIFSGITFERRWRIVSVKFSGI